MFQTDNLYDVCDDTRDVADRAVVSDIAETETKRPELTLDAKGVDWAGMLAKRLNHFGFHKGEVDDRDFKMATEAYVKMARVIEPRRRGLFVYGQCGNGKTTFMKAVYAETNRAVRFINLADPRSLDFIDLSKCDFEEVDRLMGYDIVLDDLGHENTTNDFGIKRDIVGEFISYYYACGRGRLSVVTNLMELKNGKWDGDKLMERYDTSYLDRLKELCVACPFVGPSLRKW